MIERDVPFDGILGALGDLQRQERDTQSDLDARAAELSATTPADQQAFETRLLHELGLIEADAARAEPNDKSERTLGRTPRPAASPPAQRRTLGFASFVMAAVALLSIVRWSATTGSRAGFDVSYTLVAPRADSTLRAADPQPSAASVPVFTLGRSLDFQLRPSTRYERPVRVVGYARSARSVHVGSAATAKASLIRFEPSMTADASGGLALMVATGPGSSLALEPGEWQLTFYVSPVDVTPVTAEDVRLQHCPSSARCLSLRARFVQH